MSVLTVRHSTDASPERLWRAFTTPELAEWFWPQRFETDVSIDPRVGGGYTVSSVPMGMAVSGTFTVVDEPSALGFTWRWDGEDAETTVTVAIEDGAVIVTHSGFETDEARDDHIQGWNDCLERLPTQ